IINAGYSAIFASLLLLTRRNIIDIKTLLQNFRIEVYTIGLHKIAELRIGTIRHRFRLSVGIYKSVNNSQRITWNSNAALYVMLALIYWANLSFHVNGTDIFTWIVENYRVIAFYFGNFWKSPIG